MLLWRIIFLAFEPRYLYFISINELQGDMVNDILCSVCCPTCVNCQTAAEIKARSGGAMAE